METRAKMLSDGARCYAKVAGSNLVKQADVFRSLDMVKARLDDEWQIFVAHYEEETARIAAP